MNGVFADTFDWVAFTHPGDAVYKPIAALDELLSDTKIFTTEEVLTEFLTFFAADPGSGAGP